MSAFTAEWQTVTGAKGKSTNRAKTEIWENAGFKSVEQSRAGKGTSGVLGEDRILKQGQSTGKGKQEILLRLELSEIQQNGLATSVGRATH